MTDTTTKVRLNQIPLNVIDEPSTPSQRIQKVLNWVEVFFVKRLHLLVYFHILMFLFFIALLVVPLFLDLKPEDATPWNNFTEFSRYLMWGLWFPLVFISVIFSGRSWCGIFCPMGAASEWANNIGLQRPIPAWVKWEGTPIVSFILVTTLGQTLSVRDFADSMAVLFGATLVSALVLGFLYGKKKRAWCRHMCPIGLLLGVFSRLGAIQFHPKSRLPGESRYVEKGPCPTMIDIPRKQESRHCIECFRCVHPGKNTGLKLTLQRPGLEVEQIRQFNPNASEMWFLFLGSGSALGGFLWLTLPLYQSIRQIVGNWFIQNEIYWVGNSGPSWLMSVHPEAREVFNWLDFIMIVSFMSATMLIIGGIMYSVTLLATKLAGSAGAIDNFKQRSIQLAYQFMPVAAVSLLIGLGGELFSGLHHFGLTEVAISRVKASVFAFAFLWSVYLAYKILRGLQVSKSKIWKPMIPGIAGSLFLSLCWWPAIF